MDKLVTCKTCGAEIAKSAKQCPQCGAKNRLPQRVLKTALVILGSIIFVAILFGEPSEPKKVEINNESPATETTSVAQANVDNTLPSVDSDVVEADTSEVSTKSQEVSFSGANYSATYKRFWSLSEDVNGLEGWMGIELKIDNKGNSEQLYLLDDVYINGVHYVASSAVPLTAAVGKSVIGRYAISTEYDMEDVKSVEFKLQVWDNNTLDVIETSDPVILEF